MPSILSLPLLISFFSHKGGVGKTTSVQNIVYTLVSVFKLKVLVIDLDTQASLTGLVMRDKFKELGTDYIKKNMTPKDRNSLKATNQVVHIGQEQFIRQRQEQNSRRRQTSYEIFEGVKSELCQYHLLWVKENFQQVLNEVEPIKVPIHKEKPDEHFLLIAGDRRLTHIDIELAEAYAAFNSNANFASFFHFMPGVISNLIRAIGKKHDVDLVLVDFGPAPNPLNRSALMGSDYLVLNCLPDFLSGWSIKSLADFLQDWNVSSKVLRRPGLENFKLPACPKFLGCVISRIKMIAKSITADKNASINFIKADMLKYLIEPFKVPTASYEENPCLIRDFTRISHRADQIGKAVSHVRPQDIPISAKKDLDDEDILLGANLNLNSYCAAIIGLFANLSEDHHRALGNIFRLNIEDIFPSSDLKLEMPTTLNNIKFKKNLKEGGDMSKVLGSQISTEDIVTSLSKDMEKGSLHVALTSDVYCAFSQKQQQRKTVIKKFMEFKEGFQQCKDHLVTVVEEIMKTKKGAFLVGVNKKKLPTLPQLNKLCYRISSEVNHKLKKKSRNNQNVQNSSQEEVVEQTNEEKLIEKYLNAYRDTRKAAAVLIHFLRQKNVVNEFFNLVKNNPKDKMLGENSFVNYCHSSENLNTLLFVPDKSKPIVTYHTPPIESHQEKDLIVCETKSFQKCFSKLISERTPKQKKSEPPSERINENAKREKTREKDNGSPPPYKRKKRT